MEFFFLILAVVVGLATVVQGGLNRLVGGAIDLNTAILLNSIVVLIISALFYLFAKFFPQAVGAFFRPQELDLQRISELGWKVILPGICGFTIVMGIPWAMSKAGALQVFLAMIFAQILFSSIWDLSVEGVPLSAKRIIGGVITLIGAIVAFI